MREKLIYLTGVNEVLKKEALDKLNKEDGIPRCDNGNTREFYEDLNVPESKIPQELKDREKEEDLDADENYEEVYSLIALYPSDISLMVSEEEETTVFLRGSNLTISVIEYAEEIEDLIEISRRNWLTRLYYKLINRNVTQTN